MLMRHLAVGSQAQTYRSVTLMQGISLVQGCLLHPSGQSPLRASDCGNGDLWDLLLGLGPAGSQQEPLVVIVISLAELLCW